MFRTPLLAALVAAATLLSGPAPAQQAVDPATAKGLLFSPRGAGLRILRHPFLSDADIATLSKMPEVAQLLYYGAMAVPPGEGLRSQSTRGAFDFHSIEAARAAAISQCNAARRGGSGCVVVAEVIPPDFEAGRPLTLSQDASKAALGRDFRRAGPDAALAISPATGAWGLGDGAQAAIASCASEGARDCVVAVAR